MGESVNQTTPSPSFCGAATSADIRVQGVDYLQQSCPLNAVYSVSHAVLILLSAAVLLRKRFYNPEVVQLYSSTSPTLLRLRYPFHDIRWLLMLALVLVTFVQVGEGVLTDTLVLDGGAHPQLFVPGLLALVGAIAFMVYYNYTELWDRPKMLWLQVVYWLVAIVNEKLRFHDLRRIPEVNLTVLKYDITLMMLMIYIAFAVMDGYLIINRIILNNKLTVWTYGTPTYAVDAMNPNIKYRNLFSNYASSISLWWLQKLFKLGYKRPLEIPDLGELPTHFKTDVCVDELQAEIANDLMSKDSVNIEDANFTKIYTRLHGGPSAVAGLQRLAGILMTLAGPLLLQKVIDQITLAFQNNPKPIDKDAGYISVPDAVQNVFALVVLLFILNFVSVVLTQRHSQTMFHVGTKVRSAIQGSVYLKSQQLSVTALSSPDMSSGQITNHIGTDPINMQLFFMFVHTLWTAPIQLIVMLGLLYSIVGPAALVGALSFLFATVIQAVVAKFIGKYQARVMGHSDSRLKGTNELLQGIKLVKLNGWEKKFQDRINESRDRELRELHKVAGLSSSMTPLALAALSFAIIVTFAIYYVIENEPLTPQILFPALSLFQAMSGPLMLIPTAIMFTINAFISHKRIKKFLQAPEVEDKIEGKFNFTMVAAKDTCHSGVHKHDELMNRLKDAGASYGTFDSTPSVAAAPRPDRLPANVAMKITNGSFAWEDAAAPNLTDINIEIPAGKLTAVVGEVGSGKSSLCAALLGEMKTLSGEVIWNSEKHSIAYASQKAWLVNASMKDNVIFGTPIDEQRYNRVIDVCGLRQDIDMLPAGDRTEIGEKGINLSGGQKQRVSLARAVYSHAAIVMLDDPMSALDAHVGSHVFKEALKNFLIEEGRSVILVTHQTQFLPEVAYVIIMRNGTVWSRGTPDEIKESDPALYESWVTAATATKELAAAEASERDQGIDKEIQALREQIKEREKELKFRRASRLTRTSSFLEEEEPLDEAGLFTAGEPGMEEDDGSTLIRAEERNKGSVPWRVYLYYLQAVGAKAVLLVFLVYICSFLFFTINNFWLSDWSEVGLNTNLTTREFKAVSKHYLIGYTFLSLSSSTFGYLTSVATFLSSLAAGKRIHQKVLQNITQSPVRFFDTTPIGRILNRFSVDTKLVDQTIGSTLSLVMQFTLSTVAGLVINVISAPFFIVGLIPLSVLYWYVTSYYISTSREVKRLESVSLSPVYSQFTETISGLATIRAYNKQACFAGVAMDKINTSTLTSLFRQGSNFWLQFRLGFIGASIIFLSGTVAICTFFAGKIDPSLVALTVTVSLFSSQQLMQLVTQSAELEMQMNAIERLKYFAELLPEKQEGVFDPPDDWPFIGDITVRNLEVRYARELEPVLQGVNLRIKGGEKVGICGRTGSGKSSMMLALFRIIVKTMGDIYIDGVNIDHVPLAVLRQRLSIVPQDPTLFTGTVRFNLDPFEQCSDEEIWAAIGIAQLKGTVSNLPNGLDSEVTEGGENFSVGQRQLFCLARAFLRKSRILIMDEATASIDKEMDAVLQDVLFTAFADKTVLTIAHRVSTILNYDTIVVLSEGKVAEWDTPNALLEKKDSIFASLVNKDK
ncbi:ATP-binding cassette sub-family C member 9-like [Acanthaster planci]|uniref:ATP-binding cassette sub-family C member 9-like n=1 Tax=Acanthaster planci TaxID=133434 RepID=A0A8B7XI67_ACAPL|nr:ATP-binding cassette sub-family C member 9-like [Acanthaster planci]XP_022080484.1 ATP-binding cassette sub-family C member 9-like [Acanthaster planci]